MHVRVCCNGGFLRSSLLAAPTRHLSGAHQRARREAAAARRLGGLLPLLEYRWTGSEIHSMDRSEWLDSWRPRLACRLVVGGRGAAALVYNLCASPCGSAVPALDLHVHMRLPQLSVSLALATDATGEIVVLGGEAKVLQVWHNIT